MIISINNKLLPITSLWLIPSCCSLKSPGSPEKFYFNFIVNFELNPISPISQLSAGHFPVPPPTSPPPWLSLVHIKFPVDLNLKVIFYISLLFFLLYLCSWHICKYLLSLLSRQRGGCLIFRFDFICSLLHIISTISVPFIFLARTNWICHFGSVDSLKLLPRRNGLPNWYAKYLCTYAVADKNAKRSLIN